METVSSKVHLKELLASGSLAGRELQEMDGRQLDWSEASVQDSVLRNMALDGVAWGVRPGLQSRSTKALSVGPVWAGWNPLCFAPATSLRPRGKGEPTPGFGWSNLFS